MTDRHVVVGVAKVRARWFSEVAGWSSAGLAPIEFVKCISASDAAQRLVERSDVAAVLLDERAPGPILELVERARRLGVALVVIAEPATAPRWREIDGAAVLPTSFGLSDLNDALRRIAVRRVDPSASSQGRPTQPTQSAARTPRPDAGRTGGIAASDHSGRSQQRVADAPGLASGAGRVPDAARAWSGQVIAVTGGAGAGTSTVAMAIAQGIAAQPGNEASTVLADFALEGSLSMYHDVRDVIPALPECVEALRAGPDGGAHLASLLFEIDERGYSLLLGARRARDWLGLDDEPLGRTIDLLRSLFRTAVIDIDPPLALRGAASSPELDRLFAGTRLTLHAADTVVVVGDPSLKSSHETVQIIRRVVEAGVDPDDVLLVINRAPRSPRARAALAGSIASLSGDAAPATSPLYVPERRGLELVHRVGAHLPDALADPLAAAVLARDRAGSNARDRLAS